MGLAVDAHVCNGIEPDLCGGADRAEIGQHEPMLEILFDVAHTWFHPTLLIAAGDVAGRDGKAMEASEVLKAGIEHRRMRRT